MAKQKLYSGLWQCPECETEYELERVKEDDLICDDCGVPLEPVGEEGKE